MKKAKEFNLNDFNFSKTTRDRITKNCDSIDDIVMTGRVVAYEKATSKKQHNKWELELAQALEDAGFVRPVEDFVRNFRFGDLYNEIYGMKEFPCNIQCLDTKAYEHFAPISDGEMEEYFFELGKRLTESEVQVLTYLFGLRGKYLSFEDLSKALNLSRSRIGQIRAKALRKMRHPATIRRLPPIFESTHEEYTRVNNLISKIKDLREQEEKLEEELKLYAKLPYKAAIDARKFFDGTCNETYLSELHVIGGCSTKRLFWNLHRANIDTVRKIIDLPKDQWKKIKGIGPKSLQQLEEIMHMVGFHSFKVS